MKRALSLLLAAGLLAGPVCAEGHTPEAAFLLSLGPGILWHGLGNRYAGEKKTANLLLVTELFGIALMGLDHSRGPIERQLGDDDREQLSRGEFSTLGRVMFLGSWLYDMASCGDAARRHRQRRVRSGLEIGFEAKPDPTYQRQSFNPQARYTVRF